jgi:hypothetical protein
LRWRYFGDIVLPRQVKVAGQPDDDEYAAKLAARNASQQRGRHHEREGNMKREPLLLIISLCIEVAIAACADACVVGDLGGPPQVTITSHPPDCCYGQVAGWIEGTAANIDTASAVIVLYAETNNFYVQPLTSSKKTEIRCNGTFRNWTHGGHHYIAILANRSWDPPDIMYSLPDVGGDILAIDREPEKRIQFSGYTWVVKSSGSVAIEPGPNIWSDSTENVWVDGQGKLHLRITYRNGEWICAEVYQEQSLGYGEYTWYVESPINQLDRNGVVGLFVYDYYVDKEIDIELTHCGEDAQCPDAQYVIQPWDVQGNRHRFCFLHPSSNTHRVDWCDSLIFFSSWKGDASIPSDSSGLVESWLYTGSNNFVPGHEEPRMNLWLWQGLAPSDGQEIEIVIDRFTWTPLYTSVLSSVAPAATSAVLEQNVPNPFNPATVIQFSIAKPARIKLRVFDLSGSLVRTLVNAWREPGVYGEVWDGRGDDGKQLPSGVYFYRLETGDVVATRKMVLLR